MRKFYVYYRRIILNPIHSSEHTDIIIVEGEVNYSVVVKKLREIWKTEEADFIPLAWSLIE